MRITRVACTLVLAASLALTAAPTWADSETTGSSPLDDAIDKTASGTKFVGPLSIFYFPVPAPPPDPTEPPCPGNIFAHMTFAVRLTKGNTLSGSAGQASSPVCFFDNDAQIEIMREFFEQTVFPTAQGVALKGVTNIFNGATSTMSFTVMDIELAVRE